MSLRFGTKAQAFSGEGARLFGGRWNSAGGAVVYTSSSLSLAALETLVHADRDRFKRDYLAFTLEIPEALLTVLQEADLPADWRSRPVSTGARRLGDAWLTGGTAVLAVPSVVVPLETNYLLNPLHPDAGKV